MNGRKANLFQNVTLRKKIRQQQNKYLKKTVGGRGASLFFLPFFFLSLFFCILFSFFFPTGPFFCYSSCFLRSLSPPSSPTPSLFFAIRWQKCATTKRRWAKRRTLRNLFFSFFFLSFFPRVGVFCFPRFVFFC